VTRGKSYEPVPLTAKEDEIRRSGGIFAVGRREFASSMATSPSIVWPEPEIARRLTTTEQILWAHRVDKDAEVRPGATLRVYADLLPASDGTAPFAIHTFNQITGGDAIWPRQIAIANDHFVFTGLEADEKQTSIGRVRKHRHRAALLRHARRRHLPLLFPGAGAGGAGHDDPRRRLAQPRLRRLRRDRDRRGLHHPRLRLEHRLHLHHGRQAATRALSRRPAAVGDRQDLVLELLRRWGAKQSQGDECRVHRPGPPAPIAFRNTICNMMAEAEAGTASSRPMTTFAWFAAGSEICLSAFRPGPTSRGRSTGADLPKCAR
jgi:hypothetical protein